MTNLARSRHRYGVPAALAVLAVVAACGPDGPDAASGVDTTAPAAASADDGADMVDDTIAPAAEPLHAWTQYGVDGLEARAIMEGEVACPAVTVDGGESVMTVRAAAGDDFPVTACAAPVDDSAREISIGAVGLPPATAAPEKILVLGDSGCRVADGWYENCDGAGTGVPWSFVAAAEAAADEDPDLIVHVGDYIYREAECDVAEQPGCAGSPWGDNWPTWEADFFTPSEALVDVAPWIVTRGNHEDCQRNYEGWLRFLDGRPIDAGQLTDDGCPLFSESYTVALDAVDFLVLNTATDPTTRNLDPPAQERYTTDFSGAAATVTPGKTAWTVTHRPFWGLVPDWRDPLRLVVTDTTLQASIDDMPGGGWPEEVDMSLAGHIHLLETLSFTDGRPHQVVSGDAGTAQDGAISEAAIAANPEVFEELDMSGDDFHSYHDFGYVLVEPAAGGGWTVTVKDIDGNVLEQFSLA